MTRRRENGRAVVRAGYDVIASSYLTARRSTFSGAELGFLRKVVEVLPPEGRVLDLGCGAGDPVTSALALRSRVIGVDISWEQLVLARRHLPAVSLVHADMAELELADASLDAVVSFAAIVHVPRDLHGKLYERIVRWLSPGGVLAVVLGTGNNEEERDPDWFGAPMYWSHHDSDRSLELIAAAGMLIEVSELLDAGSDGSWLGVIARRPAG